MDDVTADIKMLVNDYEFYYVVVWIEVMVKDFRLRILNLHWEWQCPIWLHLESYCVDLLKYLNRVCLNSHDLSHLVQYYSCSRWKNLNVHSCNKQSFQFSIFIPFFNWCDFFQSYYFLYFENILHSIAIFVTISKGFYFVDPKKITFRLFRE